MSTAAPVPISAAAHVRKETFISCIISMAFSAGFFLLIFRGINPIAVAAPDYLALDFLPQSAVASFMAALMPALKTRTAMARGVLPGPAPTAKSVVLRAIMFSLLGLGLAGVVNVLLKVSGISVFSWGTAFAMKVGFGALLGLIMTPLSVRAVLTKG